MTHQRKWLWRLIPNARTHQVNSCKDIPDSDDMLARLKKVNASVKAMKADLNEARDNAKEWEEVAMDVSTEYAKDFERLTNEIYRYKTALEKIAHTDDADGPPHLWVRIARTALEIK